MKALTIRRVDATLARALERETRRRGTSLNQTILDLLHQSLGIDHRGTRSNGLAKLAGSWTDEELAEFEDNVAAFEQVDAELWS